MQIDFDGERYFAICSFEERHEFRRAAWTFSNARKRWETTAPSLADKFYDCSIGKARERLTAIRAVIHQSLAASMAVETESEFWSPEGKKYLDFQKAGVEYILSRRDTLLADQPGLGKTIQALGVMNNDPSINRVLIVVPASLQYNWRREAFYWLSSKFKVGLTRSKAVKDKETNRTKTVHVWPQDVNVIITTYDMLEAYYDKVRENVWDLLVCDEAHLLCGNTIRSKNVFGGGRGTMARLPIPENKSLFITGTPITRKPINLWNFCKKCDPEGLGANYKHFVMRYCGGHDTQFGLFKEGATNSEELQIKLRTKFMIRRMKMDVLKDLPPKVRQIVELPAEGCKKVVKKELAIFAQNIAALLTDGEADEDEVYKEVSYEALEAFVSDAANKAVDYSAVRNEEYSLEDFIKVHFEAMGIAREEVGLAKVPMVIEYAKRLIDDGEKVVIMTAHKAVAAALRQAFPKCAFVTGDVLSKKKRQDEVDRFQSDEECNPFIGNISAAGVGYTLTAACHLIFAELSFNPAEMEQAEDRIHRIGQFETAFIHYLVIRGSIEAGVISILIEKQEVIEKTLDWKEETLNQNSQLKDDDFC